MGLKKILYVGTIIAAVGFGAMIGPMVGNAAVDSLQLANQFGPKFMAENNLNNQAMGLRMGQYFAGKMQTVVADTVKMTVDELYALRSEGQSIEQIANSRGVTTETLLEVLITAKTEQLEDLVAAGVITEDQKTYVLERMKERMTINIKRTEVGPFNNGMMGQGRGMRFNSDVSSQTYQGKGFGGGPRWANTNN